MPVWIRQSSCNLLQRFNQGTERMESLTLSIPMIPCSAWQPRKLDRESGRGRDHVEGGEREEMRAYAENRCHMSLLLAAEACGILAENTSEVTEERKYSISVQASELD